MKKILFNTVIIAGAFSISVIYSCKKNDTTPAPANTNATTVSNNNTFADDQNMYSSENTQTNGDITSDIETNQSSMARSSEGSPTPQSTLVCGASVTLSNDTLTYTFDGSTHCYGRTRSGTILVSLAGGHLNAANATLTITYVGYKVTRLYDNKSITFNGTKTLTDIGGFTWLNVLAGQDTIQVKERAYNMHVTFSGGATAVWNSARISKWSYSGGVVYFSCNGDTLAGGHNLTDWGTDRFNQSFVVYVNTIYSANSNCGSAYPTSGEVVYIVNNSTLTLTLGTDQSGNPLNSGCPGYFKIAWVLGNGDNGTAVFAYY